MTQTGFAWDADVSLPVAGRTPLARHCSATGAQAAAVRAGSLLARLLEEFGRAEQLTLAEAAALLVVQPHSLCSTWNRAEHTLGWIEETGACKTYDLQGRTVKQAYHRLSEAGRRARFERLKATVAGMEGR